MKKILFLIFIMLIPYITIAQDLMINDNVYDKADEFVKQRNAFNRERWFYEQRMFPFNSIPVDAYKNAIEQRNRLREINGFYTDNSNNWVNIGPTCGTYFNYGNISSRIVTIQYDPNNPNIIYFGAAFGGVWKSTDVGVSWTPKTDYEVSLSSGSLAIDPNNSNIIYYGTGEATYSGASYYGRGLLKSTDAGNTWTNYGSDLPSLTYTSRIVIRPNHSNELLAAMGNSGLYKSTNAGVNWSLVQSGRCDDVVFSPTGDTAYIVGSGTGYRISIDGGSTFTYYYVALLGTRNHLAICKSQPNVLYLSKYASGNISVFKSTNAGYNFSQVSVGTNFNGGQAWYDFYMHVNPFDPNYAYVGSIDIWRTTNGGTSFQNITHGYTGGSVHVDQHNLAFHPTDSDKMFCANDGGVWYSTNRGTSWSNMNSTLTLTQFYRIAADPSNASHVMGGTQDNGTQRTLGTLNWTGAFGGDGGEVCFHMQNSQYILGETQYNGVRRSLNGGSSWSSATNGLSGSGAWVGPLLSHPDSLGVFYTARQTVFKTNNYASSWFSISTGTAGTIREMAISKSDPKIMYATSSNRVYKSTNRGYSFTLVSSGMPSRTVKSIYIHPDSSNVVLVTFSGFGSGKVYKTTNGGQTWNNISGNLPDSPANDVLIYYPGYATSVYLVAMDIGVFMTNDYGNSWIELAQGLPNTVAIHLDYNQTANKVRIGTHGRGVYEITGLVTGIVNINNQTPEKYTLSQNYPNPFNPTTLIRFSILGNENVKLKVYNLLGKEIATLVNKNLNAGTYDINFDGSKLSSGVYIYKIETDNFTDSKKMILKK